MALSTPQRFLPGTAMTGTTEPANETQNTRICEADATQCQPTPAPSQPIAPNEAAQLTAMASGVFLLPRVQAGHGRIGGAHPRDRNRMTTIKHTIPKGERYIIAVDGPAGAGKGAVCRAVAAQFRLAYLETGALYRALGLLAWREQRDITPELAHRAQTMPFAFQAASDTPTKWRAFLGSEDVTDALRDEQIGQAASRLAALPPIRSALLTWQRRYGGQQNSILDGRDVGTIVWPDADLKIFLTATLAERAKRRAFELQERGENVSLSQIGAWMAERDQRDAERTHAPLKPAPDAIQVDTTTLTLAQSIQVVASHIKALLASTKVSVKSL